MNHQEDTKQLASKHAVIHWFIHNPVAANLLMIGILLIGLYMVGFFGLFGQHAKLRLEAFPSQEPSIVTITASIRGSTPENVANGVTTKIEQALQGIQGIEKTNSESWSNFAAIYVKAQTGYSVDKLYDDIKTQVDSVRNLPREVEKVIVKKAAWQPSILWVTLHGNATLKTLKKEATQLKNKLLKSPYIEKIDFYGSQADAISIEISEDTLKRYHLTLGQVASAIDSASLDLPSGHIETHQGRLSLRVKSQAYSQADYENLIIRSASDGTLIRLGDIANVSDSFGEQKFYTGFNGDTSITLALKSGKAANVIEADKAAANIVNAFKKTLPSNIQTTIWNNRVSAVKDRINLFIRNSVFGVILVFLLLTLFLNVRLAFWVALGIPISFCGALILMKVFDISISLVSLFGFILVLGIVVDDAIVIGESVYSWKKRSHNAPNATLIGTSRVAVAATFGVLTTVAAFLPLTQIDSGFGNLLGQIGAVIIFCLLFSLLESKFILPAHLYPIQVATREHQAKNPWERLQLALAHGLENFIEKTYLPILMHALRHRYFTLTVFISIFILSIGTVIGKILPVAMMPRVEDQSISLTVEMDNSVSVDETIRWAKKAEKDLKIADRQLMKEQGSNKPNIKNALAYNSSNTTFTVRADLANSKTRQVSASVISNRWRKVIGEIPQSTSIHFSSRRGFGGSDIELEILSDDHPKQNAAAKALTKAIKQIKGVNDVTNSQQETTNELLIALKPQANSYGVSKALLANTIRAAFYGVEAERVQRQDEEATVTVKYPANERKSLTSLYQLNVRTPTGKTLPISAVAELTYAHAREHVEHINGQRAITVSATLDKDKISTEQAMSIIVTKVLPKIKQQYNVSIGLAGEAKEDDNTAKSMQLGFLASLAFIYILLAIPLKSYSRPLIIMAVIPFGITGAIIGHLLLGMTLSMLSIFGIIALSGVVVNDSLLLLSGIQKNQEEGLGFSEAILATGTRRFRPIILTSITTFVGLLPMLFETSFQAQFLIPMAVSLGFGILFATLITLILVPILYAIFNDIFHFFFQKTA